MILGFEMFGAFLFGVVFAAVTIAVVGRRIVRKKLAGFIDLTGMMGATSPGTMVKVPPGIHYTTDPSKITSSSE